MVINVTAACTMAFMGLTLHEGTHGSELRVSAAEILASCCGGLRACHVCTFHVASSARALKTLLLPGAYWLLCSASCVVCLC